MADTITLTKDFMLYKSGQVLEVVRPDERAFICTDPEDGEKVIIPIERAVWTKDLAKETKPIEKTEEIVVVGENEIATLAYLQGVWRDIATATTFYRDAAKVSQKEAEDMVKLLCDTLDGEETFFVPLNLKQKETTTSSEKFEVSSTMSPEETSVLIDMLEEQDQSSAMIIESDGVKYTPLEVLPEPIKPSVEENQIWLSDITGGVLPESGIDHLLDRYSSSHFEEGLRADIPEVDPYYKWDADVLEALIIAYKLGEKVLITGPPGTGKTTAIHQFGAWIRQPYMRIGGRGDMESASLLGYMIAEKGRMEWKDGLLPQGLRKGYLVSIDEVMKIPAHIQMAMQHLYEKRGYLTLDDKPGTRADKMVHPTVEFKLFLTDNVKGTGDSFEKFGATQIQDTSTLDRISINVSLDYMKYEDETSMLERMFPTADKKLIGKLVQLAGLIRNAYKCNQLALTLSPRGLIAILDMHISLGIPVNTAINLAFLNKIADEAEVQAVQQMITKTVKL